jgi:hypothetical protein
MGEEQRMEVLIADATSTDFDGDPKIWQAALERELRGFDLSVAIGKSDIGPGADWPMILAAFSAIGSVFLLGESVEKGLDAWIRLARRFRELVARLRNNFGATRVDETGAKLLALNRIAEEESTLASVEAVVLGLVPIHQFEDRNPARLDSRVDALYLHAYRVNNQSIYVIGITARGEIEFVKKYGSSWFDFLPPAT